MTSVGLCRLLAVGVDKTLPPIVRGTGAQGPRCGQSARPMELRIEWTRPVSDVRKPANSAEGA